MTNNEANILKISRLLTPEHQADLLTWVHLAYTAENSARKSLGAFSRKTQGYPCKNNAQRRKK